MGPHIQNYDVRVLTVSLLASMRHTKFYLAACLSSQCWLVGTFFLMQGFTNRLLWCQPIRHRHYELVICSQVWIGLLFHQIIRQTLPGSELLSDWYGGASSHEGPVIYPETCTSVSENWQFWLALPLPRYFVCQRATGVVCSQNKDGHWHFLPWPRTILQIW